MSLSVNISIEHKLILFSKRVDLRSYSSKADGNINKARSESTSLQNEAKAKVCYIFGNPLEASAKSFKENLMRDAFN